MVTVREFGETNPTQERSISGGGLRYKRLNRQERSTGGGGLRRKRLNGLTKPGEFAQQCAGGILARTKPNAELASAGERQ